MNQFLKDVLAAHGGLERWNCFNTVSATVVTGGDFWATKGLEMDSFERRATAALHRQWSSVTPFGNPQWTMTFVPERVVIESNDNTLIAERADPLAAFAGHELTTAWDPLHRAYFNGYALWTYMTTPFLLTMPGVEVTEVAPWKEGNETWRVLRAKFPAEWAKHSVEQDFYFGPDLLLRRHDYQVDISGGFKAAQYVYDMKAFDGIMFPTKRRAHPRLDDGQADREKVLVAIDLSNYQLR
jgi:hypothetical protein